MHVTACLAGEDGVDVEVGEECRSLQVLREAIVEALPKLCVDGFDVCVGGRALDDDEGVVSLQDGLSLDVVPNTRGLSVLALREAGREVSEDGLLNAVDEGNVTLAKLYLDAGVPIDCVDDADGRTPLHMSCYNGDVELATLLLDRGAAIDQKDGGSATPLRLACHSENLEIVTLLLDRGSAAIDTKDSDGWTPLYLMCRRGNAKLATLLLDRGAAIDEKTSGGDTPLHLACGTRYSSKAWSGDEHLKLATLLLDRGAAIDETNCGGETPLHRACYYEYVEVVRLLLDRGSTAITAKNSQGDTPLQVARGSVLKLLSERGHGVLRDDAPENAKRRRLGEQ